MEFLAAVVEEGFLAFHGDLFQRFEAVGDEAGTDDIDAFGAFLRQHFERRVRVGLQPFHFAEA